MSKAENGPAETTEENAPAPEPNDTLSKVHELQKRFYKACGELFKNVEYVGEPMSDLMLKHYFEQYKREYELMNAKEFIEVDKQIEELKIEREREIKAIELEKAKLIEELAMERERQLEEVKLEHKALTAEIERKREKLNNDIDILWNTAVLEAQIKISRITPQSWRRFHIGKLHFGRLCKNEAMELAEIAANNDITKYLTTRAQSVSECGEEEEISEPEPLSKREYKRWQKRFEKEQRKRKDKGREELLSDELEEDTAGATETSVQSTEPDTAA